MGRPLTGRIVFNESRGTFTASLPSGSPKGGRRTATFATRREAERWIAKGLRLLDTGKEVPPHPRTRGVSTTPTATGTRFLIVAREFIAERYAQDHHGDIDREDQVTGYAVAIDDYLAHHQLTLESLTRRDARTMWQHMLKVAPPTADASTPDGVNPDGLVTKKEALRLLAGHGHPISESTFKRAVHRGALAAADTSMPAHLFATTDVFSAEASLVRRVPRQGDPPSRSRYAHSTLRDVRRLFRSVIAHAAADGIPVAKGVRGAEIPRDETPKVRARALILAEAARIAGRLHVVHQCALWLMMLLGLRHSEAYGILVEDVIDRGPGEHGLVIIQAQGGRQFRRRQPDGSIATTTHVDETKGDRSNRVLVVPTILMDMIRTVIDVFHTDDNGDVRPNARLIPGLGEEDTSGQSAFRNALTNAGLAETVDITFDQAWRAAKGAPRANPTPQRLRQSYASTHHSDLIPIEDIRATLGQNLGDSVLHLNYLIDDVDLKASKRIADATQAQLIGELGGRIMIPTSVSCTTGRQPALAGRAAEIDAKLLDAGWWNDGTPAGDWLDVADAAAYLGIGQQQVRHKVRTGRQPAISTPRPDQGGRRYLISHADLHDHDTDGNHSEMRALAAELGVHYDAVRQLVRRHSELALVREPGRRAGSLPDDADAYVRQYFSDQAALQSRALRLTDVAKDLGISVASINTLIKNGELFEDSRFHGGFRSLTRASVEEFKDRVGRGQRRKDPA